MVPRVSTDDLFRMIGQREVEIEILKNQVRELELLNIKLSAPAPVEVPAPAPVELASVPDASPRGTV